MYRSTTETGMTACAERQRGDRGERRDQGAGKLCWVKTWGVPWIDDWDNPQGRVPSGATLMANGQKSSNAKRQIILIRHGQYSGESHGVDDSKRVLTATGERQAHATGEYLRRLLIQGSSLLVDVPNKGSAEESGRDSGKVLPRRRIDFVVSSDLHRAKQTAAILMEELKKPEDGSGAFWSKASGPSACWWLGPAALTPVEDSLLQERFPCDPQPPFKGKAAKEKATRAAEEAFMKYFHRPLVGQTSVGCDSSVTVIVGHANMIRYLLCRSLQIPPEAWLRFSLSHCSITNIVINANGTIKVLEVGSAGHLSPDCQLQNNVA